MIENMRLNSLVIIAFCAAVPALAQTQTQTQTTTPSAAQPQTQPRAHTQSVKAPAPRPPYTVEFKITHAQTQPNGTVITTESK